MDKLPEPEFNSDKVWNRYKHGTEALLAESDKKFMYWFAGLSAVSIYKYWREVTFYKKNVGTFAVIAGLYLFSSYNIARFMTEDPFVTAAVSNNQAESKYIEQYKNLYKEAKAKGLTIPDNLIL